MTRKLIGALCNAAFIACEVDAQKKKSIQGEIEEWENEIETKCINWRRSFHEHPELGNSEFKTAKIIADHLRFLGLDVKEGVAHTGVVGILKGSKPGPVIGLRADMDALPV